jgi:Raf kinase inhibitor-like YbhB/YbcL family protein
MKNMVMRLMTLIMVLSLTMVAAGQTSGFSLSSAAVKGNAETGFFTGLVSAGRLDAVYAAKPADPLNQRSFPVSWKGLPDGTAALALVFDDPDAKPVMQAYGMKGDAFLHWTAADIDPSAGGLADNASAGKHSFVQGVNAGGTTGYVGPRPPSDFPKGKKAPLIHIYRLTVYALSARTGLKDGFSLDQLNAALKGKVIARSVMNISYSN